MSLDHKVTLLSITCGLSLLVSGGLFFLISAGLTHPSWQILGITGLALGLIVLSSGLIFWLCGIKATVSTDARWKQGGVAGGGGGGGGGGREETETFNVNGNEEV